VGRDAKGSDRCTGSLDRQARKSLTFVHKFRLGLTAIFDTTSCSMNLHIFQHI
jgi:hypothetical protein